MSLTKAVMRAIESAFSDPRLGEFSRLDAKDGHSFHRYYCRSETAEREVSVYRDKRWTKSGGKVYVELFCLPAELQIAIGGVNQSWLNLDYGRPAVHFQYRSSRGAQSTERTVESNDDAEKLAVWMVDFLVATGLPWFRSFDSNEGVTDYLEHEAFQILLARWHAHLGNREAALDAFQSYLLEYPRDIERELSEMESVGLIDAAQRASILKASIQEQAVYEREVRRWCESRRA